jgi:predicted transcriptional regulator
MTHKSVLNKNRLIIYQLVSYLQGIRYRELLRITRFTNGTLAYHLEILEKNGLIKRFRLERGKITRYYPYGVSTETAVAVGYLRTVVTRQILMLLYNTRISSFSQIIAHIDKSPSTTSWHLKKLVESGLVVRNKRERNLEFSLKNPKSIKRLIDTKMKVFVNNDLQPNVYT